MKKFIPLLFVTLLIVVSSCNAARRAELQQKKQQEKLQRLEADKQQFEEKNKKELGK